MSRGERKEAQWELAKATAWFRGEQLIWLLLMFGFFAPIGAGIGLLVFLTRGSFNALKEFLCLALDMLDDYREFLYDMGREVKEGNPKRSDRLCLAKQRYKTCGKSPSGSTGN